MKKILISVAALSLVVVMGVMLAACSASPVGKWELYSITIDGETYKEGDAEFDAAKEYYSFEFTEDGKVIMRNEEGITWKQDGKKITITVTGDGTEVVYTLDGDTLTGESEGAKLVFKKVE